jgi:poly-gamma-glutamate synthesis protein (capsule biosynthesis protein)
MDWGRAGLAETLRTLRDAGIRTAGAGCEANEAAAPAAIAVCGAGRILVFACGMESSGVPAAWAAAPGRAGVSMLPDLSARSVDAVAQQVGAHKRSGDLVVLSIHWGGNWGHAITSGERAFAHRLIDTAGVDLVHGHSSHHAKAIEVHRGKLILYGCGDFVNDYEGIHGYEIYRGDLALMYFPTLDVATGRLLRLAMTPTRTQRFRVNRAPREDACWLLEMLNREGRRFGTRAEPREDGTLLLRWA